MSEEIEIKAFEIIEKKLDFAALEENERQIVLKAFGSESAYKRMLRISDFAYEDEEIIAPSLTTEHQLMKAFKDKHNIEKQESKKSEMSWFFNAKWVKFALPLVLVAGLFLWFNTNENTQNEVAQVKQKVDTEEILKNEDPAPIENAGLGLNDNLHADSSFIREEKNVEDFTNAPLEEIEKEENLNLTLEEVEETETDIIEIAENEVDQIAEVTDQKTTSIYLHDTLTQLDITPDRNADKIALSEEEQLFEDIARMDDSYGNSEGTVLLDQKEKFKDVAKNKRYRSKEKDLLANKMYLSSNAQEDIELLDFLFSTY